VSRAREASVLGLGIGLGILVWSSSGIFTAIRRGLNAATRTKRGRPFLKAKLIDFTLIPCFGTLIVLAVAAMAVIQIGIENAQDIGPLEIDPNAATRAASSVVGAVVSFVGFLLLYRFVPRTRPRWGEAIAGALFATLLFEAAKQLYALVFALLPYSRDTALYAGFGTALTFLLWMFINASILLLGAEFARALRATGPRVDRDAEGFVKPFQ
jgi:membrane protein